MCGGAVDGDGYSDIVVGSYLNSQNGMAHLYRGGLTGTSTTSTWSAGDPGGTGRLFGGGGVWL